MNNAWNHVLSQVTKLPSKAYKWPKSSPTHRPPARFSRRSQLRFTPAKTLPERWVARCLLKAHSLLRAGDEAAALQLCYDQMVVPRGSCLEFLHSAVSLFTRHGSFESALNLCNHMVDMGYILQNKTFMVMLRGDISQRAEYLAKVREAMARGGARMDELSFKALLDMMVKHRSAPEEVEEAFDAFEKSQADDWIPTVAIFHTIICAWSMADALDRAEYWLGKYRDTLKAMSVPRTSLPGVTQPPTAAVLQKSPSEARSTIEPRHLYLAILTGLARSQKPAAERIQRLMTVMRQDGIALDLEMHNMIIRALLNWGMMSRAFRMFKELLRPRPGSTIIPDAYSFRQVFIALNPRRPKGLRRTSQVATQQPIADDISTRRIFSEMIRISRLRLRTRHPLPHKNLISTATFNCALGTFCAQDDYAAAWNVLALFTWYNMVPDAKTSRIVVHSLLRRMRYEMSAAHDITDVLWLDRFAFERRSTIAAKTYPVMLADCLYLVGRVSLAEMKHEGFQRYLRPSHAFDDETAIELEFMIALLRSALQADLGFKTLTVQSAEAEKAISGAMLRARDEMIPRGRTERN